MAQPTMGYLRLPKTKTILEKELYALKQRIVESYSGS
jgi:hypothetical protein